MISHDFTLNVTLYRWTLNPTSHYLITYHFYLFILHATHAIHPPANVHIRTVSHIHPKIYVYIPWVLPKHCFLPVDVMKVSRGSLHQYDKITTPENQRLEPENTPVEKAETSTIFTNFGVPAVGFQGCIYPLSSQGFGMPQLDPIIFAYPPQN